MLATNHEYYSTPRQIAHFPLDLRTKSAHSPLNLQAKYHVLYKCKYMEPITSTAFRMYVRTSEAHNDQGSMKHEQT